MADLRSLIQRKQGFLFLPLVYRLAARLEQMDWEEFSEDPASAAYAIRAAQRLFDLPAVVSHFRVGAEAEACGADLGRDEHGEWRQPAVLGDPAAVEAAIERAPLSQVLDVTARLSEELKGQAGVVAVLTGPRTLSSLFAETPTGLGQFYAALARAYAERGAQMFLVVEDPRAPEAVGAGLKPAPTLLAPLFNVANYFRVPTVLLDVQRAEPSPGFGLTLGTPSTPLLPLSLLQAPPDQPSTWKQQASPLLSTEWEVPPDLPAEHLSAWVEELNAT